MLGGVGEGVWMGQDSRRRKTAAGLTCVVGVGSKH